MGLEGRTGPARAEALGRWVVVGELARPGVREPAWAAVAHVLHTDARSVLVEVLPAPFVEGTDHLSRLERALVSHQLQQPLLNLRIGKRLDVPRLGRLEGGAQRLRGPRRPLDRHCLVRVHDAWDDVLSGRAWDAPYLLGEERECAVFQ